jgi:hypothetical protein
MRHCRSIAVALSVGLAVLLATTGAGEHASGHVILAPMFIPIIIAAAAWGAGLISGLALIVTIATTALSFIAQTLLQKGSAGPSPGQDAGRVKIDQQQSIRQPAQPRRVIYGQARVGGVYAFEHTGDGNQDLWFCLMIAGHRIEKVREIYFDDQKLIFADDDSFGHVVGGKYNGVVEISVNLGEDDQEADTLLLRVPDKWTENDRLRGVANICGVLRWDNTTGDGTIGSKIWTGGIPNITAVVDGYNRIYDPRDDSTGYSNNSALIVNDYLTNTSWGRKADYATRIDEAALIVAANIADETITKAGGATEARYACDGSFLTDAQPDDILGKLLATMHGEACFDGNRWTIYAGAYQAPTITLTDDDMRAASKVSTMTSARDSFNGVKGTFTGPDVNWTEADFASIQSSSMLERDGGREQWKDIELPFVISGSRARRIAKIDLLLTQQEIVEQFYGKLSCFRVKAGITVYRTSKRFGWTNKLFKVAKCQVGAEDGPPPVIGFDLVLQEIAADAWDYHTSEDVEQDPAPDTDFPNIFPLPPQGPFTYSETLYQSASGMPFQSLVHFAWEPPNDSFVTSGGGYLFRYRKVGDTNWTPVPQSREPYHDEPAMTAGLYEAQVRSVSWADITSSDYLSLDFEIYGIADAPSPPGDLTVVPLAGGTVAHATWNEAVDIDVLRGGFIHLRHSILSTGATWAQSVTISRPLPGGATEALLPLIAGTYMAKSQDAGGTFSDAFTGFVQSKDSAWDFVTIASLDEAPTFSGTKTNCIVGGDDFLRIDDIDTPAGTYEFASDIDLGLALNVRVSAIVDAFSENSSDQVDTRAALVDEWPDWDGSPVGAETDTWTEMRKTTDDPAGSPTWSPWQRFHTVEARARGLQFRAQLISNDPAFTPAVIALGVVVEEVGTGT